MKLTETQLRQIVKEELGDARRQQTPSAKYTVPLTKAIEQLVDAFVSVNEGVEVTVGAAKEEWDDETMRLAKTLKLRVTKLVDAIEEELMRGDKNGPW